ncbi:hypothetical protein [Paracoccus luteus]|uniref:aromatic-ring hydroxylase C-terminal domain-containing protein n=1 Tax=Paracoccus luteus TaxID=2508543 RepID=UPI003CCC7B63
MVRRHKAAEFYARGVVLGYCYRDSPAIADDGTQKDWRPSLDYTPSATPGCIAPHCWLADGSSLYDHFGAGFTLLVTRDADPAQIDAARSAIEAEDIPLTVLAPQDDRLAGLYQAPLVLIRPDQHVAWRGDRAPSRDVLERLLGRRAVAAA